MMIPPSNLRAISLAFFLAACSDGFAENASAFWSTLSDGSTPPVVYEFSQSAAGLELRVGVEDLRSGLPAPQVVVGLDGAKTLIRSSREAAPVREGDQWIYRFEWPQAVVGKSGEIRFGLEVDWVGPEGRSVQKQSFFVPTYWPAFRGIGGSPEAWAVFDLNAYFAQKELLAQRIAFEIEQPSDGIASVVIEDADGRRVRNLVSGQPLAEGLHQMLWDGLDDEGTPVRPGKFTWRAITHPGLKPELLMFFNNPGEAPWLGRAWLADHSNPTSAAAFGERVVLGAPVAEAGNNLVLTDLDGNLLAKAHISSFIGKGRMFLALGPDRIFAFNEGSPQFKSLRKDEQGKPYLYGDISVVAWDLKGQQLRYKGKSGEHLIRQYRRPLEEGRGSRRNQLALDNLRGATYLDGRIYLSLHDENILLALDPNTGKELASIPVKKPGALVSDGKTLFVLSNNDVLQVSDPAGTPKIKKLFTARLSDPLPVVSGTGLAMLSAPAMAVGAGGEILITDNGSDQNVKVFHPSGKLLRELGRRGGRAARGPWEASALRHPYGLAVDSKNQAWIAENVSTPKRVSVWDVGTGEVVREFFGPTPYGGAGGGVDPLDVSRWVGGGSLWKLDLDKHTARIESVLHNKTEPGQMADTIDGRNVGFARQDGKTFLYTKTNVLEYFELLPDGSAKIRAVMASLSGFQAAWPRWAVPAVFLEHPLLAEELSAFTEPAGPLGDLRNHAATSGTKNARDYFILWTDVNGDEIAQVEELQVSVKGRQLVIPYWSMVNPTLDLGMLAKEENGDPLRTTLKLQGFHPSGAPDWRLEQAYADAVPLETLRPSNLQSTLLDANNRLLVNSSPMAAVDARGATLWTYPNNWVGVHGSHTAPLPETGVLQGAMSFLGEASFDKEGSITVLNGNHGRCFVMTTDGIYLDEMFEDVRVAPALSALRIGGEAFGGTFTRDPATGRYLLQVGHGAYRIYEVKGLNQLKRSSGGIEVTAKQAQAAAKLADAKAAETVETKIAAIPTLDPKIRLGTEIAKWPGPWLAEWGDPARAFPRVQVKAGRQNDELILGFVVKDPSPWVNRGTARNLLFKSGDAVDFQFSTNPDAKPDRKAPVEGDRRLLIADFEGKPSAILYDFVVPGTESPVAFNSPDRSTLIDAVSQITDATIEVVKKTDSYSLIARIPLSALGLPADGPVSLRGDFGAIYGDAEGKVNTLRSYWSNQATGLVDDVPGEAQINPAMWGHLEFQ